MFGPGRLGALGVTRLPPDRLDLAPCPELDDAEEHRAASRACWQAELAAGCPGIERGGLVEVRPVMPLNSAHRCLSGDDVAERLHTVLRASRSTTG